MKTQVISAIHAIGFFCVIPGFFILLFTALNQIHYENFSKVMLFDLASFFLVTATGLWLWTNDSWVAASVMLVAIIVAYLVFL